LHRHTHRVTLVLAELHVDLKIDDGRVAELKGFEAAVQRARFGILLEAGEDGVRGATPFVEQLDFFVVEAALGDEVARKDVEDALPVELDSEEERLAQLGTGNVLSVLVDDAQEDGRLGGGAVDNGGGNAGDSGLDGIGVSGVNGSINIRRKTRFRDWRKEKRDI
jgi:hypothetical protein